MIDFEKGILHRGLWGPIRRCMDRAEQGENITVAFLGGSITQGSLSSTPETCYAYRVYRWWQESFPRANIRYINAGIGGTGSYFGAARVQEHVLQFEPDFLLTEFAVNDDGADHGTGETYEGLIRRILTAPKVPALMLMHNVCYDSGSNAENFHLPVAQHYGLPCVSMKYTIYPELASGRIPNRSITPDDLHPNDAGHELVAQGIICLLEKIRGWQGEEEHGELPEPLYCDAYTHTSLLQNGSCQPELQGFEADPTPQNHITETFRRGWTAWEAGDRITFHTRGRRFGVLYRKSVRQPAPVARVTVDGVDCGILDANFAETWGDCTYIRPIGSFGTGEHTVTLQLLPMEEAAAVPFYLIALVVSE